MRIVCFGDFLLHFSPHDNDRFLQTDLMSMSYTGAEMNVCCALAFWGEKTEFVTKIPDNALSLKGKMFLNSFKIKTDNIKYGEGRMGLYFLEKGHALRPSSVIYDRTNTVFTNLSFEDYDWDIVLNSARAFYLSGITPSLSGSLFECCKKVLKKAREYNVPVFYDVNLRPTICSIDKSREIFNSLSPYITHLISNEEHLKQLLDFKCEETENVCRLFDISKITFEKTKIKNIAITVRRTISAHQTCIYSSFYNGDEIAISPHYEIDVVDRVGSGDAFSAGIVYAVLNNLSLQDTINFAAASCALKHTINSDINFSTVDEIKNVVHNNRLDVKR